MLLLPKDGNYINMNGKTSRDLRQEECVEKWIKNRCKGTIIAATGFFKILQKPFYRGIYRIITNQYRGKA